MGAFTSGTMCEECGVRLHSNECSFAIAHHPLECMTIQLQQNFKKMMYQRGWDAQKRASRSTFFADRKSTGAFVYSVAIHKWPIPVKTPEIPPLPPPPRRFEDSEEYIPMRPVKRLYALYQTRCRSHQHARVLLDIERDRSD